MSVIVLLDLKFKAESLAEATDAFRRELVTTRAFAGNLTTEVLVDEDDVTHWVVYEIWDSVPADDAYRSFRAGEGEMTQLPSWLEAPFVKTRFMTSDV
jgi:quinol monooxygenase YgiN